MGNLLVLFTIERLSHDQALHAPSHACKLLIAKEMVGASGLTVLLVPNNAYQFHKRFVWRRLGTRTRLFSPLNCPYVVRKMKKPDWRWDFSAMPARGREAI